MILAHFTANDSSSAAIVFGLALLFFAARSAVTKGRNRQRRAMQLIGGLALLAGGIALGWVH